MLVVFRFWASTGILLLSGDLMFVLEALRADQGNLICTNFLTLSFGGQQAVYLANHSLSTPPPHGLIL